MIYKWEKTDQSDFFQTTYKIKEQWSNEDLKKKGVKHCGPEMLYVDLKTIEKLSAREWAYLT